MRIWVEDVHRHVDSEVTLRGWLYGRRSSGKLHFLQVRDGTGTIQCVVFVKDVAAEVFERAGHVPQESSLEVTGTVRADARSPLGVELAVKDLRVLQEAHEYPITPKEHGPHFLLDHRHLWLRSSRQHAIMRVRASVVRALRRVDVRNTLLVVTGRRHVGPRIGAVFVRTGPDQLARDLGAD